MGKRVIAVLAIVVLIVGTVVPVHAQRGGHGGGGRSFHGGGGHSFHGHGGFRHGCCAGAFFGAFALGAALSYPFYAYPYYRYPYYAYPYAYSYPYPAYSYSSPAYSYPASTYPAYSSGYATQPPLAQSLDTAPSRPTAVQREVVYPDGKYVLYGDGVTQPWRWVWEPAAPAPAPPAR
jgi:hypothetical protein